jgi:excisionase family DNA binding protein
MLANALECKMLTPVEVALRLRVHVGTVYRAIDSGQLDAFRLGETGSLRVPVSALEDYLRPAHERPDGGSAE